MIRSAAGHSKHFAVNVLAAELSIALDFQVLLRREIFDWLSGHRTGIYQSNADRFPITALQGEQLAIDIFVAHLGEAFDLEVLLDRKVSNLPSGHGRAIS